MPPNKASNPAVAADLDPPRVADALPAFAERHYRVEQIAEWWNCSPDKVRRIFEDEPGVLVLEGNGARYGKRRHRMLLIPESVAQRVHRKLSVVRDSRQ